MADQDSTQKDTYFVAVKVFLEKDEKLLICKDKFGEWDLPGGRIKKSEFETPLKDVITRKMLEELGSDLMYGVEERPSVLMRHERTEAPLGNPVRIFGIGYRAQWICGEITLSEAHTEMLWIDPKHFNPEEYFTGGWLKGVHEYLMLRNQR
jgi:ADP-ribose pyrophosphatase YjhB (NUDIX family)